jgi:hypothetical protein
MRTGVTVFGDDIAPEKDFMKARLTTFIDLLWLM